MKAKLPKFHRQRFILALISMAGGSLSRMDFQKLLFLSQQEADFSYFDFVPYQYGCYSFQAQSDVELLCKMGWLDSTSNRILVKQSPGLSLDLEAQARLDQFISCYKSMRGKKLVSHVYSAYPYYATRSRIANEVLDDLSKVSKEKSKLKSKTTAIYTIGYEGITFEAYVNKLIQHDVKLLCDVRRNPLSRKFGFSKGALSQLLPKMGIQYLHIPELGIASELRRDLDTEADYAKLFKDYRKYLPGQQPSLNLLEKLLTEHKRIALTCFEKEHTSCHRHCVSDYLEKERSLKVCHL